VICHLTGWSVLYHRLKDHHPDYLRANLLLYPHHGAELNCSSPEFIHAGMLVQALSPAELLRLVDPEIIVISVGTEQPPNYHHPRRATFELLAQHRAERKERGLSFRLTCTELTTQCLNDPIRMRKDALVWKQTAGHDLSYANRKTSTCPCAGSVSVFIRPGGSWYSLPPDDEHQDFIDGVVNLGGSPGCRRRIIK
jgi:hypothetical protein